MANTLNDRVKKWSRLGGPPLTNFVEQIISEVLPFFFENGFERVSRYMGDENDVISAREIRLERVVEGEIKGISISFDKYHRPSLQMRVERRLATGSQDWVRAANVVKRPTQYICFWGAPWYLPARLWSPVKSRQVAERVRGLSHDILAFLDDGQPSRHLRSTADTMHQ